MKLSDLFENSSTSQKERAFQDAWTAAGVMLKAKNIPPAYYGKVQSRAHELAVSYGMEVDDAIGTAASEVAAKMTQQSTSSDARQGTAAKKIDNPYADKAKRASASDRRWANQHGSGGGSTPMGKFTQDIKDLRKSPFDSKLNTNSRRKR
jgi:hypothetical protein